MAELTSMQAEVLGQDLLRQSLVLQSPTGSGKTWLSKHAALETVAAGHRVIYLSPLRALAKELFLSWRSALAGIRVGVYTGELGVDELEDNPPASEAQIIIATPEKLDLFLRAFAEHLGWLARVDLLIVDELHTIASDRRGGVLEGVVTRFRHINPYMRVLTMSATLGNPTELASWLGGKAHVCTERPVPLEWRIRPYKSGESKADVVVDEVAAIARDGKQCIVFAQSRPRVESLVAKLEAAGIRAVPHHAGLSRAARERAESAYRSAQAACICATGTLAMGLNLGARAVIIHDLQRWANGGWQDLRVSEVSQLGGRAGRKGVDERGEVVLLAPQWNQKSARRYVAGAFEPIRSTLGASASGFAEQVLVAFGSGLALTEDQCVRVMSQSLLAHEIGPEHLGIRVTNAVDEMVAARMLQRSEAEFLRPTKLGRIAVRFQLSPATVTSWAALDQGLPTANLLDLLLAVCACVDFTARVRVDHSEVGALQDLADAEPMELRAMPPAKWMPFIGVRGKELAAAMKTALALRMWVRTGQEEDVNRGLGVLDHELDEARKEAVRMLQAMAAVFAARATTAAAARGGQTASNADKARALAAMVSAGLNDEQATLALINGIGPVLARRIAAAGVNDIEDLALCDPRALAEVQGISFSRATRWIEEAGKLVKDGGALRYREVCRREVPRAPFNTSGTVDPQRWQRAQSLDVRPAEAGSWTVTGGSAPHRVWTFSDGYRCDCMDASRGNSCKHVLAVRRQVDGQSAGDRQQGTASANFSLVHQWATHKMVPR